tara:strand:- start:1205 stop:1474 length:270 start_codon:yes stop_codon:yes gene_type:complete
MKTTEEILHMLEYLSQDYVEDPKWRLEDMVKLHSSLDENNIMTYISYLAIRKDDITADERDTIEKIIKIKRALERREINKRYGHFTLIE